MGAHAGVHRGVRGAGDGRLADPRALGGRVIRTAKFFVGLLAVYGALLSLAFWAPPVLAEPAAWLFLVPFFTPHLLHKLGVPGLLEQGGHCGWGWCSPTVAGSIVLVAFWLGVAWLAAWGLARLTRGKPGP